MELGWKSLRASIALALLCVFCGACQQDGGLRPTTAPETSSAAATQDAGIRLAAALSGTNAAPAAGASTNGAASQMPAFYDGALFTVNMMELRASASIIAHNGNFNEIYASNDLDDEQDFTPVIDAIQGDGFNPLWRQNLIVFNPGVTPHQVKSDEEVVTAAAGTNPEITIVQTDEIYRCSVVGTK